MNKLSRIFHLACFFLSFSHYACTDDAESSTKITNIDLLRPYYSYETPASLPADISKPYSSEIIFFHRQLVRELTKGDEFSFTIPQLDKKFFATVTRIEKPSNDVKIVQAQYKHQQQTYHISILQELNFADIEITTLKGNYIAEAYGDTCFIATEEIMMSHP